MTGQPLAVAATLTVAAGLLRRRWELQRDRRDERSPLGPSTPTHTEQGPLARRIADWVPAVPGSRTAHVAASAWTAPLTTIGGLVVLLGGARARWDPDRACWVATGVGGPSAFLLERLGLHANTIGQVVVVRTERASPTLLDHEAVHVRQSERLGPLLPGLYALLTVRYGYRENPLERGARRGAARATGRP